MPSKATLIKASKTLPLLAAGFMLMPQANALDIKQEQINACVQNVVTSKIADNATANKLCSCSIEVESKITKGQMWEAESYRVSGKDVSTLPSVQKYINDLKQCEQGLTLNPPQQPTQPPAKKAN